MKIWMILLLSAVAISLVVAVAVVSRMIDTSMLVWRTEDWDTDFTPHDLRRGLASDDVKQDDRHFKHSRVIVCGLLRDAEAQITYLRSPQSFLSQLLGQFADYRVLITENDSSDKTREKLLEWSNADSRVRVLGCDGVNLPVCHLSMPKTLSHSAGVKRIKKMTRLRNVCLEHIDSNQAEFEGFDYVVVVDMDLQSRLYVDGLRSTAWMFARSTSEAPVNAVAAWGITDVAASSKKGPTFMVYSDPYAHKHSDGSNLDRNEGINTTLFSLSQRYRYGQPPVLCMSSFGGITIYRKSAIHGLRYQDEYNSKGHPLCEHVTFHKQLKGFYMNPSMIHLITSNPGTTFEPLALLNPK